MKLSDVITRADGIKPNALTNDIKTQWINEVEGMVQTDIMLIDIDDVEQYTYSTDYNDTLLVKPPHDKLYITYLCAMIDFANGEYDKYQNTMALFNVHYSEYVRWYARTYHPADGRAVTSGYYISAYGIAVAHGYSGTETEWLASLKGAKGDTGTGFIIKGRYDTYAELIAAVTDPDEGDAYDVGTSAPYTVYQWDAVNEEWYNRGSLKGADGVTPSINASNKHWMIGTTDTGVIAEGEDGTDGVGIQSVTLNADYTLTITYTNGTSVTTTSVRGATGNGIQSVTQNADYTLTITFTDGTTFTTSAVRGATGATGNGISSIAKTGTSGKVDTYTITYTDGNTTTFTVTNGEDGTAANYNSVYVASYAATAAKLGTSNNFTLNDTATYLYIKFKYGNTATSDVTLNINASGAKPLYLNGAAISVDNYSFSAGSYIVYYDGTNYYLRTDGKLENIYTESEADTLIGAKQNSTDNSLTTTAKTIVGGINEVNNVAKGANIALGVANYQTLVTMLNGSTAAAYKVGQNIYVQTLEVPDVWVYSVEDTAVTYTYTTDAALVTALASGAVQMGYYKISKLETQKVDLTNYQAKISASGMLKGDGNGGVTAAVAGTDYAPVYAPYTTLTAAATLTSTELGKYIMANGTFTLTMPTATSDMAGAEMEIHNVGTGTITLTGAFLYGGTANASKSFTLAGDEAITVKCVGTGSGAWTIIGAFTEV